MNLKEIKVNFNCLIAGYKVNDIDTNDLLRWLEQQMKSYVGAKDIGIMGEAQLIIEREKNGS